MDILKNLKQVGLSLFGRRKRWVILAAALGLVLFLPAAYTLSKEPPRFRTSAVVYLVFAQAAGGGSAAVGTTALTSTPQAFTANASGVITITYKTPSVLPTSGMIDAIRARSAPTHPIVVASDTYTF